MWLRDALPRSLPRVRPIIYGYDSALLGHNSFQSILDISIGLIHQLKNNGWSSPTCKPLAFVAHSLGGIVLKQTLVALASKAGGDEPILQSLRGAVFFGVPNLGMEQSHFMAAVEGYYNEKIIQDLALDSPSLLQLDSQFNGISCLQEATNFWCYETKTSPRSLSVRPSTVLFLKIIVT
jgi:hypothetical protein